MHLWVYVAVPFPVCFKLPSPLGLPGGRFGPSIGPFLKESTKRIRWMKDQEVLAMNSLEWNISA
jgi:hypothetical protein